MWFSLLKITRTKSRGAFDADGSKLFNLQRISRFEFHTYTGKVIVLLTSLLLCPLLRILITSGFRLWRKSILWFIEIWFLFLSIDLRTCIFSHGSCTFFPWEDFSSGFFLLSVLTRPHYAWVNPIGLFICILVFSPSGWTFLYLVIFYSNLIY